MTTLALEPALTDAGRAWFEATRIGFLQSKAHEQTLTRWWALSQADHFRLKMILPTAPVGSLGPDFPLATLGSVDATINVGNGALAAAGFVTDVIVRPTHRRRGLLRRILTHELAECHQRGLAFSALTASEAGIHRRFGYGVSTSFQRVDVDTSDRFQFRHSVAARVELADASQLADLRAELFQIVHRLHRGSHQRLSFHEHVFSGAWDYERQKEEPEVRAAIHFDENGQPDGIVSYSAHESEDVVKVREFLAATTDAELGLWSFLASIDLTPKVSHPNLAIDSPLRWALADPRVISVSKASDYTWLRILDVAAALSVRGWEHDGALTLRVVDDLGFADGCWRLEVRGGQANVVASPDEPDLTMDVASLGSLYFGLVRPRTLAAAGDIAGSPEAIAAADQLFGVREAPYNMTGF